jgi:Uma2 family endonuclease
MGTPVTSAKPFRVGTTGWTIRDLMDPRIEPLWQNGAYEVIEGVLATMPPAFFHASACLDRLVDRAKASFGHDPSVGQFAPEVDIAVNEDRVVRADSVFATPGDLDRQAKAVAERPWIEDPKRCPFFIPPTLVIESVSPGHERHDRVTKRRWYAEAGVPNYWILDPLGKSLECLVLEGGEYAVDQAGTADDELRPRLFPGLILRLRELWA